MYTYVFQQSKAKGSTYLLDQLFTDGFLRVVVGLQGGLAVDKDLPGNAKREEGRLS